MDALEGDAARAQQVLQQNPSWTDAHEAVARYLVGDRQVGLADLSKLTEQWNVKTYHLRNDPLFDPLRTDPGFDAIVKASGLLDH